MKQNEVKYADLDEIVFDGREKAYGAYHIRKTYQRYLERAALLTMLVFLSITGLPKMIDWIRPEEPFLVVTEHEFPPLEDVTILDENKPKEEDEVKVKEAELPKTPDVDQTKFVEIKPVLDSKADPDATIADIEKLDTTAIGKMDLKGTGDSDIAYDFDDIGDGEGGDPELDQPKDTVPDYRAYVPLDKEPKAVNLDEIRKLIGYPRMAIEGGIEGKVVLRVFIDKYGDYKKHVVTNVAHPYLISAVTAKITQLKMTPGIQGNRAIPVWVTVPFEFKLTK